jgi:dihydrofolate reductase
MGAGTDSVVAIYIAITPNGMIAKRDDDTTWISEIEWGMFSRFVNDHGNMVIGKRTYEILVAHDEFNRPELGSIRTVVLSDTRIDVHDPSHVSVAYSPTEALAQLGEFETVVIAGGGSMNSSFMRENLVDELFLDIEPIVFGSGIRVFDDANFEANLELVDVLRYARHGVQLRYRVKRA